jgi:hypothetical protein
MNMNDIDEIIYKVNKLQKELENLHKILNSFRADVPCRSKHPIPNDDCERCNRKYACWTSRE